MADNGILTGVRVLLKVASIASPNVLKPFGLLMDCTISDGIDWAAIKVVGSLVTAEHAPIDYNVSVDCGRFYRLKGGTASSNAGEAYASDGSMTEQDEFPVMGSGDDTTFLTNAIAASGGFDGAVIERVGSKSLGTLVGLLPARRSMSFGANSVLTTRLSFVARLFKEAGNA